MKLNVKGLVFVGFAAAVFAGAANAATPTGDAAKKTVTSVSFTEATYLKGVKEHGAQDPIAPVNGIVELPAAQTVGTGTLTVKRNNSSVGTFNANATADGEINIAVPTTVAELTDHADYELVANKAGTITGNELDTTKYPTTKAVADYVDTAVAAEANVQADWNQTTTTADDYIKNKPTALSQFTDDLGDQKTANLSASITTDTGSTTKYPSVAAVEAYMSAYAPTIEAIPSTCTSSAPCALVAAGDGAKWEPIQQ